MLQTIDREIRTRELESSPRVHVPAGVSRRLAPAIALAMISAGLASPIGRSPIVGMRGRGPRVGCRHGMGGDCQACDALDAARAEAEGAIAHGCGASNPTNQRGPGAPNWRNVDPNQITPENCWRFGLRYVPVGVNLDAGVLINTANTLEIELQANFLPYLHTVTPNSTSSAINITQISYNLQPMLIGGIVNGEQFSIANQQGGYRLPTRQWMGRNDVITYAWTALAAFAANALQITAFGFTDAPG